MWIEAPGGRLRGGRLRPGRHGTASDTTSYSDASLHFMTERQQSLTRSTIPRLRTTRIFQTGWGSVESIGDDTTMKWHIFKKSTGVAPDVSVPILCSTSRPTTLLTLLSTVHISNSVSRVGVEAWDWAFESETNRTGPVHGGACFQTRHKLIMRERELRQARAARRSRGWLSLQRR